MRDTAEEVKTNSFATFIHGLLHMDAQVLDDQPELFYNSAVST